MLKIYSHRFSVARGWQWKEERSCLESEAAQWLAIFEADEPNVEFLLSDTKPVDKLNKSF